MRVLCLGNNTEDTDNKTRNLADIVCHGGLSELNGSLPELSDTGWYHSSVYDIEYGLLVKLAKQFDRVIMLDQPKDQYSHPDAFYKTVRLIKSLPNGEFLDDDYAKKINFFENLVNTNKSFCIFPFIELLVYDGNTTVCCRSQKPITQINQLDNFSTDANYQTIRQSMLDGDLLPEHCSACYKLEARGILSARQQETVEWATRLDLTSINDLRHITKPVYYEVRPSNICNLQCRMCNPDSSHLIAKEYKQIGLMKDLIKDYTEKEYSDFSFIDFTNLKKLYVAGGEPTAMPEFYSFLDRCIQNKQTDFELVINTNAVKLSNKFKQQAKQFNHLSFIISIDGYNQVNTYIRWPSEWSIVIEHAHYLQERHTISFNVTVSIYNILNLYQLLKFFDQEFSGTLVHCQPAESLNDILSPFRFPNNKLAGSSLLPIRKLKCYQNNWLLQSFIDELISHYELDPIIDTNKLQEFFAFNDRLDQSRSVKLIDYIPELENLRI
jgi:hypothetical protein